MADEAPVLARHESGATVTTADILADIDRIPPDIRKEVLSKPDNIRRMALNVMVRRVLAAREEAAGAEKDPLIATRLRLAREKVLSDAAIQKNDGEPPEDAVLEKAAQAEYRAYPEKYRVTEAVRIRQLLVAKFRPEGRKLAEELLKDIKENGRFEIIATRYSDDANTKQQGGDMGFVERNKLVKPLNDSAFALAKPGDVSDIIETDQGWYIQTLVERRAAGLKPFDEVKAEIKRAAARRVLDGRREALTQPLEMGAKFEEPTVEAFAAKMR